MSAVPHDSDRTGTPEPPAAEPGWQERGGLTFVQAEALLDLLEASGVSRRQTRMDAGGVTVRWRPTWPQLLAR